MRFSIALGALLLTTPAFAGGPTQGTFAGQDTRGSQVSANAHKYNDLGTNYGQGQVQREVAEDGGRAGNVQGNIGLDTTVGNGSDK